MSAATKSQLAAHNRPQELLVEGRPLNDSERRFVLDAWRPDSMPAHQLAGAYFTPHDIARDLARQVGGRRVLDLCARIGRLAFECRYQRATDTPRELACIVEERPAPPPHDSEKVSTETPSVTADLPHLGEGWRLVQYANQDRWWLHRHDRIRGYIKRYTNMSGNKTGWEAFECIGHRRYRYLNATAPASNNPRSNYLSRSVALAAWGIASHPDHHAANPDLDPQLACTPEAHTVTIDLDALLATPSPELPTFDHPDQLTSVQQAVQARAGTASTAVARADHETVATRLLALRDAWSCRLDASPDRRADM